MAAPAGKGKIDVKKIGKAHLFQGKEALYLDIAIWPNRDGVDAYGNTHYITQSVSKDARDRGEKGAIIGNIKMEQEAPPQRQQPAARPAKPPARPAKPPARPPVDPDLDADAASDLPF